MGFDKIWNYLLSATLILIFNFFNVKDFVDYDCIFLSAEEEMKNGPCPECYLLELEGGLPKYRTNDCTVDGS